MSTDRLLDKEDVTHIYRSSFISRTNREVANTRELLMELREQRILLRTNRMIVLEHVAVSKINLGTTNKEAY